VKLVIALDGDLLASVNSNQGMQGQMDAIVRVADQVGPLIEAGHNLVITHGNAPQVGYVLLRGEAARHVVHSLPLDICGADTQGATGYMLQQALTNWLFQHGLQIEVSTIVTQVIVDESAPSGAPSTKGIGPYFDIGSVQSLKINRGWELDLIPGQGYQRVVPCLTPKEIVETDSIRSLIETGAVVICAGGGGIPVIRDDRGCIHGVEAVVDKAYTATLLANEIGTENIVFVSPIERIATVFDLGINTKLRQIDLSELDTLIKTKPNMEDSLQHKLIAGRYFLQKKGRSVFIVPPDQLGAFPNKCTGVWLTAK